MRYQKVAATFWLVLFVSGSSFAASFHPFHGWRTIDTKHFSVHYPHPLEEVAQKTARHLEEAHEKLSPKYQWKPWGRTQVILTDSNDDANGMASTLPYNWMHLRVAPSDPENSLGTYDNWLKTLITHEYTHILHLDAYGGFWRPFRWVLGKMVAPAGTTPGWIREGTATLEETVETEGGRGRASYSEMLIRTAVLYDKFPTIDRADGLHWKWPAAQTQYIFGVNFFQFLNDKYGADKLQVFHRKTQRSFFLYAINKHAKKVYGKSFYKLWEEWQYKLKEEYITWEYHQKKGGVTEPEIYLGGKDSYYLPTLSKDGKKLAYVSLNPRRAPRLVVQDIENGKEKIVSQKVPSQISFSPDGKTLVFSALVSPRRFYFYYDLFQIDLEAKRPKEKRLTKGERAKDPDFSPDGKKILFVSGEKGTDQIKLYDVETKNITTLVSRVKPYTQFAQPRYSPNGSQFIIVRYLEGEGWHLCLANADGTLVKKITSQKNIPVVSRPTWISDGKSIVYSSDEEGVFNLYSYHLKSGSKKRLTNIKTGLFQPAISPNGDWLLARHYTGEGFEIVKLWDWRGEKVGEKQAVTDKGTFPSVMRPSDNVGERPQSEIPRKYNPFRQSLFLPRFFAPGFYLLDNGLLGSIATGSSDPLHYHNWLGGATYRTDAMHLGYFGQYSYNRFKPIFGVGIDDLAVDFGNITFARTGNTYHFYEERRRGSAFVTMPLGKGHSAGLSYFYEDRMPISNILAAEAQDLNLGIFAGINFNYFFGSAETYPASISPIEKGRLIRASTTITDSVLRSNANNEQKIVTGDYREFISLGKSQVVAFRLAGGAAFGDAIVPGTFSFGGSLGEGVMAGQYSSRYFTFRGLPVSSLIRDRVLISSLEYRMPVVSPQRGLGTWPLFLNNLHLAVFSDVGDAWDDRDVRTKNSLSDFVDDFFVSTGLEGRADFVIGHGLPVTGRLGYAIVVINRDRLGNLEDPFLGNRVSNGILILQFGTSF